MATLVDTNVLIDVAVRDPVWLRWSRGKLEQAQRAGAVLINQIIYSELSIRYETPEDLDQLIPAEEFRREGLPWAAAFAAAKAFALYRRAGGQTREGAARLPDRRTRRDPGLCPAHQGSGRLPHLLSHRPPHRTGHAPMIGKLKGIVDEIAEDHCIIDVQGVGYVAFCPTRTLAGLPGPGEAVTLFIETYVREDMIRLYGFASALERDWFRLMQNNVQGVGARIALAVLSTLSPSELANAVALRDVAMVSRAPGVGKKVAERIVSELRDKAPAYAGEATGTIGLKQELGANAAPAPVADAVSALTNLGYSRDVAANAVAAAMKEAGEGADSARLIRLGLKELAR